MIIIGLGTVFVYFEIQNNNLVSVDMISLD